MCRSWILLLPCLASFYSASISEVVLPEFAHEIANVTVAVGRDAALTCVANNLGSYKVAWVKVDTQTILTIDETVITRNPRVSVRSSDAERRHWTLLIKEVRPKDGGIFMCQINTEPMMSKIAWLQVAVPPDIIDTESSTDLLVSEGSNVSLRCTAVGEPPPRVSWRREDGRPLMLPSPVNEYHQRPIYSYNDSVMHFVKVNRLAMGPYMCVASNGIPPSVSKRIVLRVQFAPAVTVPNQLLGVEEGDEIVLECHCESFPRAVTYWVKDSGEVIIPVLPGARHKVENIEMGFLTHMMLQIRKIRPDDFGRYRCLCKNPLGEADGTVEIYQMFTEKPPTDYDVELENDIIRYDVVPIINEILIEEATEDASDTKRKRLKVLASSESRSWSVHCRQYFNTLLMLASLFLIFGGI